MKVVYSGCRYNSIVLTPTDDLEQWLHAVDGSLREAVNGDPQKYKVNPRNVPTFTNFIVQPANNPDVYPDELRCRLATTRTGTEIDDRVITTSFVDQSGNDVAPQDIWSGGTILPIFKLSYYKQGDDFGLQLTLIKGMYEAPVDSRVSNGDWEFDLPRRQ
jgi:hypothetical protein